jgi:transposase
MPGKHKNRISTRSPSRPVNQRLSERERVSILTLYRAAGYSATRIAIELRLSRSTVQSCIQQGFMTPKRPQGRLPILTTQKRKRLVARATQNAFHRRLTLDAIADLKKIRVSSRALVKAFEREGYRRRVARKKPFLTEKQANTRLE